MDSIFSDIFACKVSIFYPQKCRDSLHSLAFFQVIFSGCIYILLFFIGKIFVGMEHALFYIEQRRNLNL